MKDVIISIVTTQDAGEGNADTIELTTDGRFHYENGLIFFSYMESALTGLEGTKTSVTVDGEGVTINREGTLTSRMLFREGQKHYFLYSLPFGSMTLGVNTKSIVSSLSEKGGDLEIEYEMDMDNSIVSKNSIKINIREVR